MLMQVKVVWIRGGAYLAELCFLFVYFVFHVNINTSGWTSALANTLIISNQSERQLLRRDEIGGVSKVIIGFPFRWVNLKSTVHYCPPLWNPKYKVIGSFPDGQLWVLLVSGSPPGYIPSNVPCVPRVSMYRSSCTSGTHVHTVPRSPKYQAAPGAHPG